MTYGVDGVEVCVQRQFEMSGGKTSCGVAIYHHTEAVQN